MSRWPLQEALYLHVGTSECQTASAGRPFKTLWALRLVFQSPLTQLMCELINTEGAGRAVEPHGTCARGAVLRSETGPGAAGVVGQVPVQGCGGGRRVHVRRSSWLTVVLVV
jgi:hypothetical protein